MAWRRYPLYWTFATVILTKDQQGRDLMLSLFCSLNTLFTNSRGPGDIREYVMWHHNNQLRCPKYLVCNHKAIRSFIVRSRVMLRPRGYNHVYIDFVITLKFDTHIGGFGAQPRGLYEDDMNVPTCDGASWRLWNQIEKLSKFWSYSTP